MMSFDKIKYFLCIHNYDAKYFDVLLPHASVFDHEQPIWDHKILYRL